eukprot:COSAG06_NODE_7966_length_2312_cov_3.934205_3_plen_155_part_00
MISVGTLPCQSSREALSHRASDSWNICGDHAGRSGGFLSFFLTSGRPICPATCHAAASHVCQSIDSWRLIVVFIQVVDELAALRDGDRLAVSPASDSNVRHLLDQSTHLLVCFLHSNSCGSIVFCASRSCVHSFLCQSKRFPQFSMAIQTILTD